MGCSEKSESVWRDVVRLTAFKLHKTQIQTQSLENTHDKAQNIQHGAELILLHNCIKFHFNGMSILISCVPWSAVMWDPDEHKQSKQSSDLNGKFKSCVFWVKEIMKGSMHY